MEILQILVNGLNDGFIISVIALSFAVVYVPTNVFHLSLGAICAICPLLAISMQNSGVATPIAFFVAIFSGLSLSVLCELISHHQLALRGSTLTAHLISSLGLYMVMINIASIVWGDNTHILRTGSEVSYSILSITITSTHLIGSIICIMLLILFYLILSKTGVGLRFRAMAANLKESSARGINVNRYRIIAFAVSGILAGAGGIVFSLDKGITPQTGGLSFLSLGIVAFIIGGRRSFYGALVGGMFVGMLRNVVESFSAIKWTDPVSYLVLIAFMIVLPDGIINIPERIESRN